jgi:hypothetical protein
MPKILPPRGIETRTVHFTASTSNTSQFPIRVYNLIIRLIFCTVTKMVHLAQIPACYTEGRCIHVYSNILHSINIQKFYMVLAVRCVLYVSQNRERLLLYTSLTDWFLWSWWKVFTARYGLIAYIKQIYNRGGVFTARYGLIAYIKQIYNRGGKRLQRGTDWLLI